MGIQTDRRRRQRKVQVDHRLLPVLQKSLSEPDHLPDPQKVSDRDRVQNLAEA